MSTKEQPVESIQTRKKVVIFSGGTVVYVRPHFSICAPAYGTIGEELAVRIDAETSTETEVILIKTKMAGGLKVETNDDLNDALTEHLADPLVKTIIMSAAVCDFEPWYIVDSEMAGVDRPDLMGKDQPRLDSTHSYTLELRPADKIIARIKKERPDILLVSFKTTSGESGLSLYTKCEKSAIANDSDIVFGNDIKNRYNMLVQKSGSFHGNREDCIGTLVEQLVKST